MSIYTDGDIVNQFQPREKQWHNKHFEEHVQLNCILFGNNGYNKITHHQIVQ